MNTWYCVHVREVPPDRTNHGIQVAGSKTAVRADEQTATDAGDGTVLLESTRSAAWLALQAIADHRLRTRARLTVRRRPATVVRPRARVPLPRVALVLARRVVARPRVVRRAPPMLTVVRLMPARVVPPRRLRVLRAPTVLLTVNLRAPARLVARPPRVDTPARRALRRLTIAAAASPLATRRLRSGLMRPPRGRSSSSFHSCCIVMLQLPTIRLGEVLPQQST
jgi:hypothetical protein